MFSLDKQLSVRQERTWSLANWSLWTALHDTLPYLTPIPIAWDTYSADPNVHFFLCGFVEMIDDLPDVQGLAKSLAESQQKGISPKEIMDFCPHFARHDNSIY